MNTGLTQSGATPGEPAAVVAQRARENAQQARAAADRMRAQSSRAVELPSKLIETPAEVRAQVMAERGVDRVALLRLPPLARLEAEVSIRAETTARARQARIHTTGAFIDLRA